MGHSLQAIPLLVHSGAGLVALLFSITRVKTHAVAYLAAPKVANPGKGRPRIYSQKVRLKDMAADDAALTSAPSLGWPV